MSGKPLELLNPNNEVESKPSSVQTNAAKSKSGGPLSRLWRWLRKPPPPTACHPQAVALEQAKQLMDDYRQTDELVDRLLEQATEINRELLLRQRLRRPVCDLKVDYCEDYMYSLLEAIRREFDTAPTDTSISVPASASAEQDTKNTIAFK